MRNLRSASAGLVVLASVLLSTGCGGGDAHTISPSSRIHPNAKSKSDVANLVAAYGQTVACNSFTGYGPRLLTRRSTVFDNTLGLWYTVVTGPEGVFETIYEDQAKTTPAGMLTYLIDDVAFTLSGSFSITQGRFAGCTGTYLQSLQTVGFNGSTSFTIPNYSVVDSQFEIQANATGQNYGTATVGVVMQSGYMQTELVNYAPDGSIATTTTDNNSCKSSFSFTSTLSGTGTITGPDPGLPAKLTWDDTGTGVLTYSDGSTASVKTWQTGG